VVKIGGGLLRSGGLDGLRRGCAEVMTLAAERPVLVVPGGGPFADAVRDVDARVGLSDGVAHVLALRAMDQLGVLLQTLLDGVPVSTRPAVPDSLAVLGAEAAFAGRPEIPESWTVTSDSLTVLAAAAIGAPEAILLKPVAGVLRRWPSEEPPLPTLTAGGLRALQAAGGGRGVDAYLADAIGRTGVAVIVRAPGSDVPGTRITAR
jgi:aspartokinase-like uncharacterized kinase